MILATTTEILNTLFTGVSTVTVVLASLILPLLLKKNSDKNNKLIAAQEALTNAFDKYFSEDFVKNDFAWYCAEILAIQKRFSLTTVHCINCKKKCTTTKYMDYFKKTIRAIPEVNNFSFKSRKWTFKIEMSVLSCYKCKSNKTIKDIKNVIK
ncbi:hypothetical protein SCHIN_v1c09400 [Spiroplasma chinense]|uniref:Uncharacterized protein n=1 Tax=Spiroplasma chinense TaxID=216932 RepID=A0A5B9Y5Q1_9MOLU|nr:hypothetical protein [Spiroplasma chinense]QEH62133.1 hypothetical protein SCHIN_v1c09400 [Spiroplasma chinense]